MATKEIGFKDLYYDLAMLLENSLEKEIDRKESPLTFMKKELERIGVHTNDEEIMSALNGIFSALSLGRTPFTLKKEGEKIILDFS